MVKALLFGVLFLIIGCVQPQSRQLQVTAVVPQVHVCFSLAYCEQGGESDKDRRAPGFGNKVVLPNTETASTSGAGYGGVLCGGGGVVQGHAGL